MLEDVQRGVVRTVADGRGGHEGDDEVGRVVEAEKLAARAAVYGILRRFIAWVVAARGAAGCNRDHAALYVVEGELR